MLMTPTTKGLAKKNIGRRSYFNFLMRVFTICCLLILGVSIGLIGGLYYRMNKLVPTAAGALDYKPAEATSIYSSDGVLLARLFEENRVVIGIKEIPKQLQDATVAIEDRRFYQHGGFDPYGIGRAALANIRHRQIEQGASTLTQQLARNIYLTRTKSLSRKVQELALAVAIERRFSKQQILEMYLNEVYYGSGAYGVESAAQTYFGKKASELTLAESALIAGLPQLPTAYSPFNNMDAAINRRNRVLDKMAEQNFITTSEAEVAKREAVRLTSRPTKIRWKAPYFVNYVLQLVSTEYGTTAVYRAGLKIYTTLDWKMQEKAEQAVREGVRKNIRKGVSQGALVSIDPQTGAIRAMVGGTDFDKNQFNVVTQGQPQTGSTFKPIVYTAALESGYTPNRTVIDEKVYFRGHNRPPWPKNYDNRYKGAMTLTTALAQSRNVPVVKIAKDIGVNKIIQYARALGINGRLPEDLTIALGSASITPLEMAIAYCAWANGGEAVRPLAISKITSANGEKLKEYRPIRNRVMSEKTAEEMDDMLRAVVTRGTGVTVYRQVAEARGKTGTTDELRHAWFIGYTPELVTAVWVGNNKPRPMRDVYGSNVCAPIWSEFMRMAVSRQKEFLAKVYSHNQGRGNEDKPKTEYRTRLRPKTPPREPVIDDNFATDTSETTPSSGTPADTPENLEGAGAVGTATQPIAEAPARAVTVLICADSGLIANTNCPHVVRKRFDANAAPSQVCGRH